MKSGHGTRYLPAKRSKDLTLTFLNPPFGNLLLRKVYLREKRIDIRTTVINVRLAGRTVHPTAEQSAAAKRLHYVD